MPHEESIRRLTRTDAVLMSTLAAVVAAVYAAGRQEDDWQWILALAATMPATSVLWALAARRAQRSPAARDTVFAVGSCVGIATVTAMVVLDGGSSPLVALFFPLTAFIAVSLPLRTTVGLVVLAVACFVVAAGDADPESILVRVTALGGLAALTMQQARAQRRARARLRDASLRDALTGLPNRALFTDRLHRAMARASRHPERGVAVAFIDLDNFKAVNDSLGHRAGDLLLRTVAPRIAGAVRATDTLARFGGDEFVVLMEDLASGEEALVVINRVLGALHEPVQLGDTAEHVRASVGLVLGDRRYRGEPEALLRDADAAMYRAKGRGGGRVEVFDETHREQLVQRVGLERDLRAAVADPSQFRLLYQPLVHLRTGATTGAECLLRWDHPRQGLVLPAEFVPVAEQAGLIRELGGWVLREACAQAACWRALPGLAGMRVSVNVSAAQIGPSGDLPGLIREALEDAGMDADGLELEITESMLIASPVEAAATFQTLVDMGVGIDLDDFGTGYSSLSSVRSFPLAAIKLDRSFVAEAHLPRNLAIVRSLVELGRGLGLTTIAEGVERLPQLELLLELGCDAAQGYLFAPPVAADEFAAVAERGFADIVARSTA